MKTSRTIETRKRNGRERGSKKVSAGMKKMEKVEGGEDGLGKAVFRSVFSVWARLSNIGWMLLWPLGWCFIGKES